jgi:anti-sigma factor RsiW
MKCSDLERYLEAFLDLRLGRSRGAILRRHIATCPTCRARVEHLRQFEVDLQRSFRAMGRVQSVWNGLEADLVRTGGLAEPPPGLPFLETTRTARPIPPPSGAEMARHLPSAGRGQPADLPVGGSANGLARWGRRVVGLALVAAAVGATITLTQGWLGDDWGELTARAYSSYRLGNDRLDLLADDVERVEDWLAARLGRSVSLPAPPEGFTLKGGRLEHGNGQPLAAVVYERAAEPTIVYLAPSGAGAAAAPSASQAAGVTQLRWETPELTYAVMGPLPAHELLAFAEPR